MKSLFAILLLGGLAVAAQSRDTFDVFTFTVPKGWAVEKSAESVAGLVEACKKREGPAVTIPSPPATELKDQIWRAIAGAVGK